MLSARFLPRWATVLQGTGCALLSEHLSNFDPSHVYIRLGVEALALCGGLLVAETLRHARSKPEIQKRMHVLIEMGPVAIIKVDERGAMNSWHRALSM